MLTICSIKAGLMASSDYRPEGVSRLRLVALNLGELWANRDKLISVALASQKCAFES